MPIIGGAIVGGSLISGIFANKAGNAQAGVSKQSLAFQKQAYADSTARMNQFLSQAQKFSKPSTYDIKALEQLAKLSETQYQVAADSYQQAADVFKSVNPAIAAAGEEAYHLIKGEESRVLTPLRNTRTQQRKDAENALAQKLGAGFRYTAAGIKALNDFDSQTADIMNNAQQSALNTVVNAGLGLSNIAGAAQSRNAAAVQSSNQASLSSIQASSELSRRQLQPFYIAAQFQPNAAGVGNAGANLASVIGNQYAGGIGLGQSISNAGAAYGYAQLAGGYGNAASSPVADYTTTLPSSIAPAGMPGYMTQGLPYQPQYNVGQLTGGQ